MADLIFKAVKSSNIAAVAWDAKNGWGWVQFKGGSKFAYDMPESLFTELSEAESVGTFFARHVKSKFRVMATWQACGIEACSNEAVPDVKPLRCSQHREHVFPDAGGFKPCTRCGLYLEQCLEHRFCHPKAS